MDGVKGLFLVGIIILSFVVAVLIHKLVLKNGKGGGDEGKISLGDLGSEHNAQALDLSKMHKKLLTQPIRQINKDGSGLITLKTGDSESNDLLIYVEEPLVYEKKLHPQIISKLTQSDALHDIKDSDDNVETKYGDNNNNNAGNPNPVDLVKIWRREHPLVNLKHAPPNVQKGAVQLQDWYSTFKNTLGDDTEWHAWLDHIERLLHGDEDIGHSSTPITPKFEYIFNWMRIYFINYGGISKCLRMFRTQIKKAMVDAVLEKMRISQKESQKEIKPTGQCTACPASWYQSCGNGKLVEVCGVDEENCKACNGWLSRHTLCEGKCEPANVNCKRGIGDVCFWIAKADKSDNKFGTFWQNSPPNVRDTIEKIIPPAASETLQLMNNWPGGNDGIITGVCSWMIKESLNNNPDYSWILADLYDICYTFGAKDFAYKKTPNQLDENEMSMQCLNGGYMVPNSEPEDVYNRSCEFDRDRPGYLSRNCSKPWSATCESDEPKHGFCAGVEK